jgi:hypothetical protein
MCEIFLLASSTVKFWYLVPLVVSISLVYGGTRHERLREILEHSLRSALWLLVFLFVILSVVWLMGLGTETEAFLPSQVHLILAALAWVFATLWIAGHAFRVSNQEGVLCLVTGGLYALVFAYKNRRHLAFPMVGMLAALGWALVSAFL